jgi:hypothetical protein
MLVLEFAMYVSVRIREGVSVAHGMAVDHPLAIGVVGEDETELAEDDVGVLVREVGGGLGRKEVAVEVVHATAATIGLIGLATTPTGAEIAPAVCSFS